MISFSDYKFYIIKNISALFFILLTITVNAQSPAQLKKEADKLYKIEDYREALKKYEQIKEHYVKNIAFKYNVGICYFNVQNIKQAITYLEYYNENIKKAKSLTNFYLARSYHLNEEFEKAADYYKRHLKTLQLKDSKRTYFKQLILQCMNGPKVRQIQSGAIVSSLGAEINSSEDDYRATFHPRISDCLFFSSNRIGSKVIDSDDKRGISKKEKRKSDIYKSKLIQGTWEKAISLSSRYNTIMGEDIISFFDEGYQFLILKGYADGKTEIVKENYDEDTIEVILPFALSAGSAYWDSDHFFVHDSLVLFSSDRPSGYGGKDLYYATLSEESGWSEAINIGPQINSQQDEVSPFLCNDGRSLYFSSNRAESMGGLDIFKSIFNDSTGLWFPPENVGIPLNSTSDDKDFAISDEGLNAGLSSDRTGGLGGFDLYSAWFRNRQSVQVSENDTIVFTEVMLHNKNSAKTVAEQSSLFNNISTSDERESDNSLKKQIYNISPIYYNSETGKTEGSRNSIDALIRLLISNPASNVVLSGHSDNSGNVENDLFLSIKQVEQLALKMIKNGVSNNQIQLRGCGQNYPVAKTTNFDGSANLISKKMNRRITIELFNIRDIKDKINFVNPEVSQLMKNDAFDNNNLKLKGLTYRVQLTETSGLFNDEILKKIKDCVTEKQPEDKKIKYLAGLSNSFSEIKIIWEKIIAKGFNKAQIVPYIDGQKISDENIPSLLEQYPDLVNYLKL